MSARLINDESSIIILADFSDGSWYASLFAMQFLYKKNSSLTILQTYNNENRGHLMMRKLNYHIKKRTKNELKTFKKRLRKHFDIEKKKIKTIQVDGELKTVLNYRPIIKEKQSLVLSTHISFEDSCKSQNGCLGKIIDTANHNLFILPDTFEGETSKKILFVGLPLKMPSIQLCKQIVEICKKTKSNLEVLIVATSLKQELTEDMQVDYCARFEGVDLTFSTILCKTKCKGINKHLNNSTRDLIIVNNE